MGEQQDGSRCRGAVHPHIQCRSRACLVLSVPTPACNACGRCACGCACVCPQPRTHQCLLVRARVYVYVCALPAGFYWIPTLAGPISLDNRGIEWLYPLVDGAPPIGWDAASHYLVLPALLVVCQYISSAIISPPIDPNAENANTQRFLYAFLPLMVGWFALNVPSGAPALVCASVC